MKTISKLAAGLLSLLLLSLCACGDPLPDPEAPQTNPYPDRLTLPTAQTVPTVLPVTEPVTSGQTSEPTEWTDPPKWSETTVPTEPPTLWEPEDGEFVRVTDYIPDIYVELRYATENNFTGQVIYGFQEPWLRYGTVKKLMAAQALLTEQGYSLKIWDGFRPVAAQYRLWEVYPDPTYVANPNNSYSSHSKGNTVDITMVLLDGTPIPMPTDFDDFSRLADRDYSDCAADAAANGVILEQAMYRAGFTGLKSEWWHYSDTVSYPVETEFCP